MPRLRRYRVPASLLLPIIFICGKLLLTPVPQILNGISSVAERERGTYWAERGWPWAFSAWVYDNIWSPTPVVRNLSITHSVLLADCAFFLVVLLTIWLLLIWWWQFNGCRFRFSLRSLMLFIFVTACGMGWWMHHATMHHREQQLIQQLKPKGIAIVDYDYFGPAWLQRLWPTDDLTPFHFAVKASGGDDWQSPIDDEAMRILGQFSHLYNFGTVRRSISDVGISYLSNCRHLSFLNLGNTGVTDFGAAHLAQLTELRYLDLMNTSVGDAGVAHFKSLTRLQNLTLLRTKITDKALETLGRLPSLENLDVAACAITDSGVESLIGSPRLSILLLGDTKITDAASESLVNMPSLTHLDVGSCSSLTDKGVLRLLDLQRLVYLYVVGPPQISIETVHLLRNRSKPFVTFIHDGRILSDGELP